MVQAEQADAALVVGVFDGLPQRCILLVHGVRARRGGVAREGEGAQFDSDHKSVARTASSAAEQLHDMRSKKGFGLLRTHSEMGLLVGFKLRLARSNCFG